MDDFMRNWGLPVASLLLAIGAAIWSVVDGKRFDRKWSRRANGASKTKPGPRP
jgi:hypothetical protein